MSQPGGQWGRMRRAEEKRRGKNIKNTRSKEVRVAALISLIFTSPHIWIWIISHPCKRLLLCFRAQRRLCGISRSLRVANTEIVTGKKKIWQHNRSRQEMLSKSISVQSIHEKLRNCKKKDYVQHVWHIHGYTHKHTHKYIQHTDKIICLWHWTTAKTLRGFFFSFKVTLTSIVFTKIFLIPFKNSSTMILAVKLLFPFYLSDNWSQNGKRI